MTRSTLLELLGAALVCGGLAAIWWPLALVVAGVTVFIMARGLTNGIN